MRNTKDRMLYKHNELTVSEGFISGTKTYLLIFLAVIIGVIVQLAFIGPTANNKEGFNGSSAENAAIIPENYLPVESASLAKLASSSKSKNASSKKDEAANKANDPSKPSKKTAGNNGSPTLQGSARKMAPRLQGGSEPAKQVAAKKPANPSSTKPLGAAVKKTKRVPAHALNQIKR